MLPKTQNTKSPAVQPIAPLAIIFTLHLMLPAIDFDDEFLLKAHEIDDVPSDWRLSSEFMPKKLPPSDGLPEFAFGVC
jgi:hypothetical protein